MLYVLTQSHSSKKFRIIANKGNDLINNKKEKLYSKINYQD